MDDNKIGKTILRISSALRRLSIKHHVTGGVVSSYYGVPRLTIDVDFSVMLPSGHRDLPAIVAELEDSFDIDLESSRGALASHGMFQALDKQTYFKVDFHAKQIVPGELERCVKREIFPGVVVPIASVEDCIMSKLIWWTMGSEKSWHDAVHVLQRQRTVSLDLLGELATHLQLSTELDMLLQEALR
ncbi:MAG: nucleotidyl transferase AbiEii/AbiGii toxin family protein [Candidatus Hydrogenedentes bacterium]|nr:nucleotidyl transferase AbiEii/AbiGii toxin family protein [Candidatus Hydrogenedentota bacterium]